MKLILAASLILAFSLGTQAKPSKPGKRMPSSVQRGVMVGGNQYGEDACGSTGLTSAKAILYVWKNDSFVKESVPAHTAVYACEKTSDNHFIGIVFGNNQECGVSEPIPTKQEYKGPCRSGWIEAKYYKPIAG